MSDEIKKVYFIPSTIENIDRSVFDYIESLKLSVDTNQGFTEVPVLWGTSERSFLSKDKKEVRDNQGTLKFPLISIRRTSFSKPLKSGGVFQGNVPEINDEQGGSLPIGKMMYQEKTMAFADAESLRLHGKSNHPGPNPKIVYKTVHAPMPVNVEVMYEITLRTEYQQQMNDLMLPFVTKPGTINFVSLESEGHKYEGFIQDQHQSSDNLANYTAEERKFETKINLKVIGYLVGQGKNREKAHFSVRQNFVEIKMPRERVTLGEIPEHEYGAYYGLPGVDPLGEDSEAQSRVQSEANVDPGTPARSNENQSARSGITLAPNAGGGSGGGGGSRNSASPRNRAAASAHTVSPTRLSMISGFAGMFMDPERTGPAMMRNSSGLLSKYVIGLLLKEKDTAPSDPKELTVPGYDVRANSETIVKSTDGGITFSPLNRGTDYTMNGNVITFTTNIQNADEIKITYIKG